MLPATSLTRGKRPALPRTPILLVTPPSIFLLDERVFMSLGILKVAAVLETAGAHVEMLDLSGIENYCDALSAHLAQSKSRHICFSTTTPQLPAVVSLVDRVRIQRPDMRVVCGGSHVTLVSAAVKLERRRGVALRAHRALADLLALFDVLVAGDGESAIFAALADHAPPLIDADEPAGGMFMSNADYDASPVPARHLVDVESYHYAIEGHRATSLIAQLGCPFGCGFCGGRSSKMLRKIRTRSVSSIVDEVAALHDCYGFTGFMFYDDELNVSKTLVELMDALSDLQNERGVEFRLRGFVKSELFTRSQADAMHRAGFRWLLCGFEAADARILENIKKGATLDDNTRVMETASNAGLKVKALMSVGHPGERPETIDAVAQWLRSVSPADFDCTAITVYPGTPYYDEAVPGERPGEWTYTAKSGDRLHARDIDFLRVADFYKGDPDGGAKSYVSTDYMTGDEIASARDALERDVRQALAIPFNPSAAARRFEHSMGQGALPPYVLRESAVG